MLSDSCSNGRMLRQLSQTEASQLNEEFPGFLAELKACRNDGQCILDTFRETSNSAQLFQKLLRNRNIQEITEQELMNSPAGPTGFLYPLAYSPSTSKMSSEDLNFIRHCETSHQLQEIGEWNNQFLVGDTDLEHRSFKGFPLDLLPAPLTDKMKQSLKDVCMNEEDLFSYDTWEDVEKQNQDEKDETKNMWHQYIVILPEAKTSKEFAHKGFCFRRGDLIQFMAKHIVFRWDGPLNSVCCPIYGDMYFGLPYPSVHVDWNGMYNLLTDPHHHFKLIKLRSEKMGSEVGVSRMHGVIQDLYSIVPQF